MSLDSFDKLVDELHPSARSEKEQSFTPPQLRHTKANRNPNSNNKHLIRDPFNNIYHWYTTTDIMKFFTLDRSTVLKHIRLGLLSPHLIDQEKHYNRKNEDNTTTSTWLIFPATTIYSYCTTYHNIMVKSLSPARIPQIIEAAARSFVNDYAYINGTFQQRETDLCLQGNVPILPYGSRSYTLAEYKELCKADKASPPANSPTKYTSKRLPLSQSEKADREEKLRAKREAAYNEAYDNYYRSCDEQKPRPLDYDRLIAKLTKHMKD